MKAARLIIGIISMFLFIFIAFQSFASRFGNTAADNGAVSGLADIILAFAMLISGIIAAAGRKSKGASIVAGFFCAFGTFYVWGIFCALRCVASIANTIPYADLKILSVLSFVFAAFFMISGVV